MSRESLIEVKDLWKRYDMGGADIEALRGISLRIERGDYISVTGPSGSGKSTLLHMIGLLDSPSDGTVIISGHDTKEMNDRELTEIRSKRMGFVFQYFALVPTMTALGNVDLQLRFAGTRGDKRHGLAREALERVGLGDRINHLPSALSGGQQQRVAIARAIAKRPDVILADEPTGNLDTASGETTVEILEELNREGIVLVIVTHNPEIAERAGKRVLVRDGLIV